MNNTIRANRAQVAIDAYLQVELGGVKTALIDLVADLMHLAEQSNEDFNLICRIAAEHFREEREIDTEQPVVGN